jgi:hypothetical protein
MGTPYPILRYQLAAFQTLCGVFSVNRDKVQTLLSLAERYVAEATLFKQRQEYLLRELERQPDEQKAEALVGAFRAAADAAARQLRNLEQQLRLSRVDVA